MYSLAVNKLCFSNTVCLCASDLTFSAVTFFFLLYFPLYLKLHWRRILLDLAQLGSCSLLEHKMRFLYCTCPDSLHELALTWLPFFAYILTGGTTPLLFIA